MPARSSQVASRLPSFAAASGDRRLLMRRDKVGVWETLLGCIKLGVVVIPATTLLTSDDLNDRIRRGHVRHVVTASADAAQFAAVPGDDAPYAGGEPVPRSPPSRRHPLTTGALVAVH